MKMLSAGWLAMAALGLALAGYVSANATKAAAPPTTATKVLTPGLWSGYLAYLTSGLGEARQFPFHFNVKSEAGKPVLYLTNKGLNGEEVLRCDEISSSGDTVTVKLHVFDAALILWRVKPIKLNENALEGRWVKYDTKMPHRVGLLVFKQSEKKQKTQLQKQRVLIGISGRWRVTFRDIKTGETYPAIGIFKEIPDNKPPKPSAPVNVVGTFLTSTGDYRYLSGWSHDNSFQLKTFDGSHAYEFNAKKQSDGSIKGVFYSYANSSVETWTAIRDDKATLPDADTLTYLKKGESRLNFKFPSIVAGGSISPTDAKYRGKVVVVQLLGSWCPNCLDESNFLAPWYEKNKQRGVEIIGLGYERSGDYAQASARLRKLRERLHIGYDLAVAGVSNKDSVAKSLPQLAKFLAFPTTIFLDKKGNVRKIRTGYSGPGTGKYYKEETAAFEREVNKLLKE